MLEENIFGNGLCEENDQHNNNGNKRQGIIVLDYDLDRDERVKIFQNYLINLSFQFRIDLRHHWNHVHSPSDGVQRAAVIIRQQRHQLVRSHG